MITSDLRAIDLIKQFEGLRLTAYKCPAGIPTIGYGHTYNVRMGQTISNIQADLFLDHDFEDAEREVLEVVTVPLSPQQLGALSSFVFNLGIGKFIGSTMYHKLQAGDYVGASNEFDKWVFAAGKKLNGLDARRAAEKELFLS